MRLRTTLSMCSAALVLVLTGCGSSVTGGDAPKTVEDKATKLAAESLAALSPAPTSSVVRNKWEKCSEETPGVHRFSYQYALKLGVDKLASQPVFDQALAYWQKQGYTLEPQTPDNPTR